MSIRMDLFAHIHKMYVCKRQKNSKLKAIYINILDYKRSKRHCRATLPITRRRLRRNDFYSLSLMMIKALFSKAGNAGCPHTDSWNENSCCE